MMLWFDTQTPEIKLWREKMVSWEYHPEAANISLAVTMQCPVCQCTQQAAVESYPVIASDGRRSEQFTNTWQTPWAKDLVASLLSLITFQRECENCGTVGGLPKLEVERLRMHLHDRMSDAWLAESLAEIGFTVDSTQHTFHYSKPADLIGPMVTA